MKGILKKLLSSLMAILIAVSIPVSSYAAEGPNVRRTPAPTLTSVEIVELTYDDKDPTGAIYVRVRYVGRPGHTSCICNDHECTLEPKYSVTIFDGREEYGAEEYFKTQYTINNIRGISTFAIRAYGTTLRPPYNTLSDMKFIPNEYYNNK